jgi:hypothetical protein
VPTCWREVWNFVGKDWSSFSARPKRSASIPCHTGGTHEADEWIASLDFWRLSWETIAINYRQNPDPSDCLPWRILIMASLGFALNLTRTVASNQSHSILSVVFVCVFKSKCSSLCKAQRKSWFDFAVMG